MTSKFSCLFSLLLIFSMCFDKNDKTQSMNVRNHLFDVRGNVIYKFDSSSIILQSIKDVVKKSCNSCAKNYHYIFKYFDGFLLSGTYGPASHYFLEYYNLRKESLTRVTEQMAYQNFQDKKINSLRETRELLEHILILDLQRMCPGKSTHKPPSFIIDSRHEFYSNYIKPYPELKIGNGIDSLILLVNKPAVEKIPTIKNGEYHIFYVYKPFIKCEYDQHYQYEYSKNIGGMICKYTIRIVDNKVNGVFEIIEFINITDVNKCKRRGVLKMLTGQ